MVLDHLTRDTPTSRTRGPERRRHPVGFRRSIYRHQKGTTVKTVAHSRGTTSGTAPRRGQTPRLRAAAGRLSQVTGSIVANGNVNQA